MSQFSGIQRLGGSHRYGKEGYEIHKRPEGSVMTIEFFLGEQAFLALNGGPVFRFNEAVSFIVNCATQEEIDYYWEKLSAGGDPEAQQCGWLKDKYGLSWQIVPIGLDELISEYGSPKAEAVMRALFQMKKPDIQKLEEAYRQQKLVS